jgi:hypothetical protein
MKKKILVAILGVLALQSLAGLSAPSLARAEDWKGQPTPFNWNAGLMAGLGVINSNAGFTVLFTGARKILNVGFAPDINNQVFGEIQMGPFIGSAGHATMFNLHARWDFVRNLEWTYYGFGGVGGNVADSGLGSSFQLLPRFGVGAIWSLEEQTKYPLFVRGEISREFIGAGLSVGF